MNMILQYTDIQYNTFVFMEILSFGFSLIIGIYSFPSVGNIYFIHHDIIILI